MLLQTRIVKAKGSFEETGSSFPPKFQQKSPSLKWPSANTYVNCILAQLEFRSKFRAAFRLWYISSTATCQGSELFPRIKQSILFQCSLSFVFWYIFKYVSQSSQVCSSQEGARELLVVMCVATLWAGNSQTVSNSKRALASGINTTTAGIIHGLNTQESQGQKYSVLWIKTATNGTSDGALVSPYKSKSILSYPWAK